MCCMFKYVFLQAKMIFCTWLLLTHHYQLHTATCSSYHDQFACSKCVFLKAKMFFGTWLLLTHHCQLHTATCSSYHDQFACSKCVFLQAKMFFASGCYSLITINFILPRVAHITNVLHVLSTCSCKLKWVFARGCYSLITINFILPRVAHITNVLHVLSTCSCKLNEFLHVVAAHSSLLISYCHV